MKQFLQITSVVAIVSLGMVGGARAVEYGTLKGKFVVEGVAPTMKKITPTKDLAVCGKHALAGEEFLVKDGALANALIFALGDAKDATKPVANIHPDLLKLKGTEVVLDNKDCRFEPHLTVVWTAQKFAVKNSDPGIGHNSFIQPFANSPQNPQIPSGAKVSIPMDKPEKIPFAVSCSIHPWMKAWVISRPDPYAAVSKASGEFSIEKLPVGEHTFQLWQETLGYVKKANINGKEQADRKGLYKFTIKAGDNDLGKIVIKAADYSTQLDKLK